MSIYQRVLGHPFVYNTIRPLLVGGIDWTPLYTALNAGPDDIILDIGCGTGIAQQYLKSFREYHGFDTDSVAIDYARTNAKGPNIRYECGLVKERDIETIRPTKIVLGGLLHHLSNTDATNLLRLCAKAPSVRTIATSDPVYVSGDLVSNLISFCDRGRFVRRRKGYLALIRDANLKIAREQTVRCHPQNGKAFYLMLTLTP